MMCFNCLLKYSLIFTDYSLISHVYLYTHYGNNTISHNHTMEYTAIYITLYNTDFFYIISQVLSFCSVNFNPWFSIRPHKRRISVKHVPSCTCLDSSFDFLLQSIQQMKLFTQYRRCQLAWLGNETLIYYCNLQNNLKKI